MKTIYINGRFLTQKLAGVNRFAYELTKALSASGRLDITIVCPQSEIKSCYDVSGFNIVKYGRGSSHFWEQVVLPFFFLCSLLHILKPPTRRSYCFDVMSTSQSILNLTGFYKGKFPYSQKFKN